VSTTALGSLEERALALAPRQAYVAGRWVDTAGGRFSVEDPATGAVLADVADCDADDAGAALAAADAAQAAWSATPPAERCRILHALNDAVLAEAEPLAALMTLEMGKPLAESRAEVDYGAAFLRWFAEEGVRIRGDWMRAPRGEATIVTTRVPVGPCLLITPWNFPLAMATRKLAPALAAGCTSVLIPAPQTPLTALALAALAERAGLPPGVLSVLPTTRAPRLSPILMADPRLRKVSFTGSTRVGRILLRQAADRVLRTSMELGGNAPFIVFEDASVEAAVEGAMLAKLRNMGQSCTAANRFLVAERVADRFAELLAARFDALRLGPGMDAGADLGPLIDARQKAKVDELLAGALANGAVEATAPRTLPGAGHFVAPVVLTGVASDDPILHEEIFGPVAPVVTFADEDEAIALANATDAGLVAFAYTESLRRTQRLTAALDVGMVGINRGMVSNAAAPFGGVKQSGLGREGGREGIGEYLATRFVSLDAA
jgi:succinate-semialdehyde dehydrogenase/glutarate-semialdehyde dehydrogenase